MDFSGSDILIVKQISKKSVILIQMNQVWKSNCPSVLEREMLNICLVTSVFLVHSDGTTRSGIEDYEAMDIETADGGPGPQRCEISLFINSLLHLQFCKENKL